MSTTELRVGTLKPIKGLKHEGFSQQLAELTVRGFDIEEFDTECEDFYCKNLVRIKGKFYELVNDKDYAEHGCEILVPQPDGSYHYVCYFYNGGACLDEVLESAMEKLEQT